MYETRSVTDTQIKKGSFSLRNGALQSISALTCLVAAVIQGLFLPITLPHGGRMLLIGTLAAALCSLLLFLLRKAKGVILFLPMVLLLSVDLLFSYPYPVGELNPIVKNLSAVSTAGLVFLLLLFAIKKVNTSLFILVGMIAKDGILCHLALDELSQWELAEADFLIGGKTGFLFVLSIALPYLFKFAVLLSLLNIRKPLNLSDPVNMGNHAATERLSGKPGLKSYPIQCIIGVMWLVCLVIQICYFNLNDSLDAVYGSNDIGLSLGNSYALNQDLYSLVSKTAVLVAIVFSVVSRKRIAALFPAVIYVLFNIKIFISIYTNISESQLQVAFFEELRFVPPILIAMTTLAIFLYYCGALGSILPAFICFVSKDLVLLYLVYLEYRHSIANMDSAAMIESVKNTFVNTTGLTLLLSTSILVTILNIAKRQTSLRRQEPSAEMD